jgi:hypothetical protein
MSELPTPIPAPPPFADPPAEIPMASLAYSAPAFRQRPGILTAVAIISIVFSCLSALVCFAAGGETFGFYILSNMTAQMSVSSVSTPNPPLTAVEASQVVMRVQSAVGNVMSPVQIQSLSAALQAPNQEFVSPQYVWSPIQSAVGQPDGSVMISFQSGTSHNFGGATLVISPTGQTTMQSSPFGPGGNPFFSLHLNPAVIVIAISEDAASFALAIYLFVAGILLLRDSPHSRTRHLRFAIIKCLLATIAVIATYLLFSEFMSAMSPTRAGAVGIASMEAILLGFLGFAYPVALFITMNTTAIRNYYAVAR